MFDNFSAFWQDRDIDPIFRFLYFLFSDLFELADKLFSFYQLRLDLIFCLGLDKLFVS